MEPIPEDIIRKAAQGDVDAFEQIYQASFGYVSRVIYRMLGSMEDAEDVTQEVFVTVYRTLPKFRFESSLKTWLYRVAVNRSLNFLNSRKRRGHSVEFDESYMSPAVPVQSDGDQEAAMALLERINPDQKACLLLRAVEGLSYDEIAESLQIPVNTVRTRIKRGREVMLTLRKEVYYEDV